MKNKFKKIVAVMALLVSVQFTFSQTTAMNFNRKDCSGTMQNLFSDLNSGKAVIIEYVMMSCSGCITAGQDLESMKAKLLLQYPGKIKTYAISFNNSTTCSTLQAWITTNGFTSLPMDSGATQVAYYGGMGMPTIVILGGGTSHSVLGSPYIGFTTSDTTSMANNIRNSLNALAGIKENNSIFASLNVFPNPASDKVRIELNLKQNAQLVIDIIDVTGKIAAKVYNSRAEAGKFVNEINTSALPPGNYIIRMDVNGSISNQKLNISR